MKVVVGSSLASLVLVDQLSKTEEVHWVKRQGRVGGVFGGIDTEYGILDIGMTNFEFGELSSRPVDLPLENYNNEAINSCRNHLNLVRSYFEQYSALSQLPEPQMIYAGDVIADFLYGHRLDVIKYFKFEQGFVDQIGLLPSDLHPSLKYETGSALEKVSYLEFCKLIYGTKIVSSIIQPWISKLGAHNFDDISSVEHRIIWSPLYYPESIVEGIRDGIVDIGLLASFAEPVETTLASLVSSVADEVSSRSAVTVVSEGTISPELIGQLVSDESVTKVFVGDRIQFTNDQPLQSKIDLLYFKAEESKIDFEYVVNAPGFEIPWYRLTRHMSLPCGEVMLCGEYPGNSINEEFAATNLGIDKYVSVEQIIPVKKICNINALNLPDLKWDRNYRMAADKIVRSSKKISLMGPGLSRWRNTLSDQVIQAHQVMKEGQ